MNWIRTSGIIAVWLTAGGHMAAVHPSGSALPTVIAQAQAGGDNSGFPAADLTFLSEITRDVVQSARVEPGQRRGNSPTNSVGFTLICPGGNYPAYWVRDFAMSLESGFVTPGEVLNHLRLTARAQNGPTARRLANGLVIPPFAIPDHINFDGGAVFYPGTMSSGNNQGNGAYGMLPPVDDHYEFVHIAYRYYVAAGATNFLGEPIGGMNLLDRLIAAFDAPRVDGQTGLVETGVDDRAVGFGFYDTVHLTGKMLFPSLLRLRAAGQLAELTEALGLADKAASYRRIKSRIMENVAPTFAGLEGLGGWLRASTDVGAQADVWGTLYALQARVLPEEAGLAAERAVLKAVHEGTITHQAAVRHVPTDLDYSPTSAWEKTAGVRVNTYQNGGYWHTPTGWLIAVVGRTDRALAFKLFDQFLRHLRDDDYRLGGGRQAPWECLGPGGYTQNGVYMTSVALPLAIFNARESASGRR